MSKPRSQATRYMKAALALMASQKVSNTVMLVQDILLTSLLAGFPSQSKPVRVMIWPSETKVGMQWMKESEYTGKRYVLRLRHQTGKDLLQGKNMVFKNNG